jgi:hypothetical protein
MKPVLGHVVVLIHDAKGNLLTQQRLAALDLSPVQETSNRTWPLRQTHNSQENRPI